MLINETRREGREETSHVAVVEQNTASSVQTNMRTFIGCWVGLLLFLNCITPSALGQGIETYIDYRVGCVTANNGACSKITLEVKRRDNEERVSRGNLTIYNNTYPNLIVRKTRNGIDEGFTADGLGVYEVFYACPNVPCPFNTSACQHTLNVGYVDGSGKFQSSSTAITINVIKRLTEVRITTIPALPAPGPGQTVTCTVTVTVEDTHPDGTRAVPVGQVLVNGEDYYPLVNTPSLSSWKSQATFTITVAYPYALIVRYLGSHQHYESVAQVKVVEPAGPIQQTNVAQLVIENEAVCHRCALASTVVNGVLGAIAGALGAVPEIGGALAAAPAIAANLCSMSLDLTVLNLCNDQDGDGLTDWVESHIGTSPVNSDTDVDGLSDAQEIDFAGGWMTIGAPPGQLSYYPNPMHRDSDGDGLYDGDELFRYQTSYASADSDGDGASDGLEVGTYDITVASQLARAFGGVATNYYSANPRDHSSPIMMDTDGDGLADGQEISLGMGIGKTPSTDGYVNCVDSDGDGVHDLQDSLLGDDVAPRTGDSTDGELKDDALPSIADPDSDGDGLTDGEEIAHGTSPIDWDTDNDRLSDSDELCVHHTDPHDPDTDSDRMLDGDEVEYTCACPQYDLNPDGEKPDDYKLLEISFLNPLNPDSDLDGLFDGSDSYPCCALEPIARDLEPIPASGEERATQESLQAPLYADLDLDGQVDDSLRLEVDAATDTVIAVAIDIGRNGLVDAWVSLLGSQRTGEDIVYTVLYALSGSTKVFVAAIHDSNNDLTPDSVAVYRSPEAEGTYEVAEQIDLDGDGERDDSLWLTFGDTETALASVDTAVLLLDVAQPGSTQIVEVSSDTWVGQGVHVVEESGNEYYVFSFTYEPPQADAKARRMRVQVWDHDMDGEPDEVEAWVEVWKEEQ